MKKFAFNAIATLVVATAFTARADILIEYPTSGDCAVCSNVLMTLNDQGTTIFGILNQNSLSAQVRFQSTNTLLATASGQADIDTTSGALTNLTIDIPSYTFTEVLFNLNALQGQGGSTTATITGNGPTDTTTLNLSQLASGSNRVRIYTINNQVISNVQISSSPGLDSVVQVRIGGLAQGQQNEPTVPEPGSMAMMGSGLLGLAFVIRRARK